MYGNATERIEKRRRERKQMEKESSPFTAQMGTCLWKGVFLNKKSRRKDSGQKPSKRSPVLLVAIWDTDMKKVLGNSSFRVKFQKQTAALLLVLVSSGCPNKIPQTGWFKKRGVYFLAILEAGSSRSRCQPIWFIMRTLFLACRWPPSHYILICQWERETERERESWRCSPNIVHEGEGFNIWILGGYNQSTALLKNSVFLKLPYHTLDL